MGDHGSVHRDKLILAGSIYEIFEFYTRQIVEVLPDILHFGRVSQKRCPVNFNCLYRAFFLILLSVVYLLTVMKLDVMSKELPTLFGSTGHIRQNSKPFKLFLLDWEFFPPFAGHLKILPDMSNETGGFCVL